MVSYSFNKCVYCVVFIYRYFPASCDHKLSTKKKLGSQRVFFSDVQFMIVHVCRLAQFICSIARSSWLRWNFSRSHLVIDLEALSP